MPYVPGVTNDVFISYAHIDDEATSDEQRWVRRFVAALRVELRRRIGLAEQEEVEIFFDARSVRTNDNLEQFKENARRSAAFVAIVSPTYVKRGWPLDELAAFTALPNTAGRIFVIESLSPEEPYPAVLQQLMHNEFWTKGEHSDTKRRLLPNEPSWEAKIQDVADHIKTLLRKLRDGGGISRASVGSARLPAAIVTEPRRTVLLAQVTDDLNEDRDQVRRFLDQYNIATLPTATYPQGGQDFAKAFEADLAKANFFVQLLGKPTSKRPPDLPQGYAHCQYELAKRERERRYDFAMLLWRRPNIDPASVTHDDGALLAMPETLVMGFESFKAEIVKQVEQADAPKKPEPQRDPASDINFFINAAHVDQDIATRVQQDFTRLGCTALLLPSYDGMATELRGKIEEKILWCDAMALVYGSVDADWVSSQAMAYSKLKRKRTEPARVVLICRAPPQPKQTHGVAMPELREIDYATGLPDDPIKDILADLRR